MRIGVIIKLWVFYSEGKEIIWTAESWQGSMPDQGQYDPLLLQREDGLSPDAHQLFKLEYITEVTGDKSCIFERVPVARDGWFYKALPKWGFKRMEEELGDGRR